MEDARLQEAGVVGPPEEVVCRRQGFFPSRRRQKEKKPCLGLKSPLESRNTASVRVSISACAHTEVTQTHGSTWRGLLREE